MKYVIFKHRTGCMMPVIIPQHVTHSMIKIDDCEPVSAGFFSINHHGQVITHGESTSLNLKPTPYDAGLLESVFNNSGMYAFIPM